MRTKKIDVNKIWIFFVISAISKVFLHFFITILAPFPLRSLLSNLPYIGCFLCFFYSLVIKQKKMPKRFLLVLVLYILFFIFLILRDINLYSRDQQFIPYFVYSIVIFISFSLIDFSDNFFLVVKKYFLIFLFCTPILIYFFINQFRFKIVFDYMFLGQAISPVAIFFIFLWKYSKKNNYFYLFIYFVFLIVILLLCNRGSFLWSALALIYVYFSISLKKKFRLYFLLLLGLIVLLFNINKIDLSGSRTIMKLLDNSITSDSGRNLYYDFATQSINENPFFGIGVFSSRAYLQEALKLPLFTSAYPHNFFLEIFMQFGLVFSLFLIFFFLIFSFLQLKNNKKDSIDFFFYILIAYYARLMLSGSYLYDFSVAMLLGYLCNNSFKENVNNEVINTNSIL